MEEGKLMPRLYHCCAAAIVNLSKISVWPTLIIKDNQLYLRSLLIRCSRGGTGRRVRLRGVCLRTWRFDSSREHLKKRINSGSLLFYTVCASTCTSDSITSRSESSSSKAMLFLVRFLSWALTASLLLAAFFVSVPLRKALRTNTYFDGNMCAFFYAIKMLYVRISGI